MKFNVGDIIQPIGNWDEEESFNGPNPNETYKVISSDGNSIGIQLPDYIGELDDVDIDDIFTGKFPCWYDKNFKLIKRKEETPFDYLDNIRQNILED